MGDMAAVAAAWFSVTLLAIWLFFAPNARAGEQSDTLLDVLRAQDGERSSGSGRVGR